MIKKFCLLLSMIVTAGIIFGSAAIAAVMRDVEVNQDFYLHDNIPINSKISDLDPTASYDFECYVEYSSHTVYLELAANDQTLQLTLNEGKYYQLEQLKPNNDGTIRYSLYSQSANGWCELW